MDKTLVVHISGLVERWALLTFQMVVGQELHGIIFRSNFVQVKNVSSIIHWSDLTFNHCWQAQLYNGRTVIYLNISWCLWSHVLSVGIVCFLSWVCMISCPLIVIECCYLQRYLVWHQVKCRLLCSHTYLIMCIYQIFFGRYLLLANSPSYNIICVINAGPHCKALNSGPAPDACLFLN